MSSCVCGQERPLGKGGPDCRGRKLCGRRPPYLISILQEPRAPAEGAEVRRAETHSLNGECRLTAPAIPEALRRRRSGATSRRMTKSSPGE